MFNVRPDDLTHASTQALIAHHLREMHANSPPDSVFALELSALSAPDITVWTAWSGDRLAGVVALRDLGYGAGELKSMRTAPDFLRKGVASTLLKHVIEVSRRRGIQRLSLETGSGPVFEPALALYHRRGFQAGESFADYQRSAFNQFLHLDLSAEPR